MGKSKGKSILEPNKSKYVRMSSDTMECVRMLNESTFRFIVCIDIDGVYHVRTADVNLKDFADKQMNKYLMESYSATAEEIRNSCEAMDGANLVIAACLFLNADEVDGIDFTFDTKKDAELFTYDFVCGMDDEYIRHAKAEREKQRKEQKYKHLKIVK